MRDNFVPSDGPKFDLHPVDPRGSNHTLPDCDLIAYFDNGAVREADGSLTTLRMSN